MKKQIYINLDADSHVTLYAIALDIDLDTRILAENPKNKVFVITNLERFYNYRTTGPKFDIVSSVLSDVTFIHFKKVDNKREKDKVTLYKPILETPCIFRNVNYSTIHLKKLRIKGAFSELSSQNKEYANNNAKVDFFNFFTTKKDSIENNQADKRVDNNEKEDNISLDAHNEAIKPEHCRGDIDRSKKKKPCSECIEVCIYKISDILDTNHGIGQSDIHAELQKHGHPRSRKYSGGTQRYTTQAGLELVEHYKYFHCII